MGSLMTPHMIPRGQTIPMVLFQERRLQKNDTLSVILPKGVI
jgi:hypothetical protein